MKLAMVTTYAKPNNIRREFLEAAVAQGHDVSVVAPESPAVMAPSLAKSGVRYLEWPVSRIGIDPKSDLRSALHLFRILRDEAPDVVLIYQVKAVLLAPTAAKLARVPHVVALINGLGSVFDDHGFGLTWKARLARALYSMSLRSVDTILFQNADDPVLLRERRLLSPRAHWRVVPGTGVDLAKFVTVPLQRGPVTFTLIARLLLSKGIREFVAAARAIRGSYPDTRFILAGPVELAGHPDAVSQQAIDGWVAEGLLDYRGVSNDIAGLLAETTVFVLPSYYREGVPRTNMEAMAVGRPVVTTDWVGCRETVEDGVTGFLVPPRDEAILRDRMERYLREPALVEQHGRAGRALVERRFDIRHVNALMLDALTKHDGEHGARQDR